MKPIFEDDDLRVVYVKWNDAFGCRDCQGHDVDETLDTDCVNLSVGYLYRETKTHLVLASDWVVPSRQAHELSYIPKSLIIEVRTIRTRKMSKTKIRGVKR